MLSIWSGPKFCHVGKGLKDIYLKVVKILNSQYDQVHTTGKPKSTKYTKATVLVKGALTLSQTRNFRLFLTERVCRRQFQS